MKKYVPTFSTVPEEVVGQIFIVPANIVLWSIRLQTLIKIPHDVKIRITNTVISDDVVLGIIQLEFKNVYPLEGFSYCDKTNGEVSVGFYNLVSV